MIKDWIREPKALDHDIYKVGYPIGTKQRSCRTVSPEIF